MAHDLPFLPGRGDIDKTGFGKGVGGTHVGVRGAVWGDGIPFDGGGTLAVGVGDGRI